MRTAVLVPVKEHARAKSRLAPILTGPERSALAWAMLEDLISALAPLRLEIVMVTDSERAGMRARQLGWSVLWESLQSTESASVDAASRLLAHEGADAVLRLPADIPLLQPADIDHLLSLPVGPRSTILVPSWDRSGTNALLRTPPDLFPSCFGPDSFALHIRQAAAAGAQIRVVENPRLALDLDDASDIARFLTRTTECETYRILTGLNIQERLAQYGCRRDSHLGLAGNS